MGCCVPFPWRRKKLGDEDDRYPPLPLSPGTTVGPDGGPQQQHLQHSASQPAIYGEVLQEPFPPAFATQPPHSPEDPPKTPQPPPRPPIFSSSGGAGSKYLGSDNPFPPLHQVEISSFAKIIFTYESLAMATDGFSAGNFLGQGGFGHVFKGVLPNGQEVAVKKLKEASAQGEREFQAEIETISRVHHKNLVSLVGYCTTGSEMMVVYDFVKNKTLEFHLHGENQPTIDWPTRLKIAYGSAKGLVYLHEDCDPKIIHRDIKASNILLTSNFEAKVSDFGLAKIFPDSNTHVSTRVIGTYGYLDPEYVTSGKLTDKSDVFSYGVVLLELITGRKPLHPTHLTLANWARSLLTRALKDKKFDALVDQRLENNYDQSEMTRMVTCAAACVLQSGPRRPRMSQIVQVLEGHAGALSDLSGGVNSSKTILKMASVSEEYGDGSSFGARTSDLLGWSR